MRAFSLAVVGALAIALSCGEGDDSSLTDYPSDVESFDLEHLDVPDGFVNEGGIHIPPGQTTDGDVLVDAYGVTYSRGNESITVVVEYYGSETAAKEVWDDLMVRRSIIIQDLIEDGLPTPKEIPISSNGISDEAYADHVVGGQLLAEFRRGPFLGAANFSIEDPESSSDDDPFEQLLVDLILQLDSRIVANARQ